MSVPTSRLFRSQDVSHLERDLGLDPANYRSATVDSIKLHYAFGVGIVVLVQANASSIMVKKPLTEP